VGLTEGADPDSIVITRETLAALTATYAEAQERARELEADREGDRAHHAAVCEELITTVASATVQKVLGSGLLREIAKTAVEAAAKAEPARHAAAQRHAATDHEAEAQRLAEEAARPRPSPPAEPSINHLTPWQQVAAGTKPAAPYVRRRPGAFE
jgi:septal ring factor EnvC (AmiA/AmiB activator)